VPEPVARPTPSAPPHPLRLPSGSELISEVERRMRAGDFAGAVQTAFLGVLADLERAYGLRVPPNWTDRDVLAHGLRTDMGQLPDLLFRLYELYEPIRYGQYRDWIREDPVALLHEIYGRTSMRSLTPGPDRPAAVPAPPPIATRSGA
jgi:hypothetical protein